jgi:hypothetical protein
MGGGEILDLAEDIFAIKMPWRISCLPCAIKLTFYVSIGMGFGKETLMTHVHLFL